MKGERFIRASALSAFVLVTAVGVCPGTSYAQEAILTDNSTIVAAKPKTDPSAASQRNLHVVGPLDARVECDALLKFDLSTLPTGTASTNILKATLVLYVNTLTRSGTFDVASVGGMWNERTVTWATAPALIQIESAGVVTVPDQFVTVDLTELVRNWVDGTITNNGIAIIPNASTIDVLFDSKENTGTSHQPQLFIATSQNVSLFPNDVGYVTMAVTNGLETIAAANAFAPMNTAPCALTNAAFTLGANFTNGNFRCFYTVSVGMVSTTVVDFINLTDATTNTVSVADVGGLILTNSIFQFAGPNEIFIINTNRSGAGQASSLISVTGKIL